MVLPTFHGNWEHFQNLMECTDVYLYEILCKVKVQVRVIGGGSWHYQYSAVQLGMLYLPSYVTLSIMPYYTVLSYFTFALQLIYTIKVILFCVLLPANPTLVLTSITQRGGTSTLTSPLSVTINDHLEEWPQVSKYLQYLHHLQYYEYG